MELQAQEVHVATQGETKKASRPPSWWLIGLSFLLALFFYKSPILSVLFLIWSVVLLVARLRGKPIKRWAFVKLFLVLLAIPLVLILFFFALLSWKSKVAIPSPSPSIGIPNAQHDVLLRADLDTIEAAIDEYYRDKSAYPETLDQLVPSYLSNLRLNQNEDTPFTYTPPSGAVSGEVCGKASDGKSLCTIL